MDVHYDKFGFNEILFLELLRKCTWFVERMEIDRADGRGGGEKTEEKVYVMPSVKKMVMWNRENYNKRRILSHSCPTVLVSKDHFHQAVSFSPCRNFSFVYMHKWGGGVHELLFLITCRFHICKFAYSKMYL